MPRRCRAAGALLTLALASAWVPGARADDAPEAVQRYEQGARLLRDGRREDALIELRASARLLPSPNTDLLIGHALRELGRRVEALRTYEKVIQDAAARLAAGDDRFRPTAADAERWAAELRRALGELRVVVEQAPPGASLHVDGAAVVAEYDEKAMAMRVRVWHERGRAAVDVRAPSGRTVSASADVSPGASSEVRLVFVATPGEPAPAASAPASPKAPAEGSGGPPATSWVAAGVGVAALGVFIGFGARAASIASDLDTCAPRCPARDYQDEAETGRTYAIVANVGLGVGAAALVAAGVLWALAPKKGATLAVALAPGAGTVHGTFR